MAHEFEAYEFRERSPEIRMPDRRVTVTLSGGVGEKDSKVVKVTTSAPKEAWFNDLLDAFFTLPLSESAGLKGNAGNVLSVRQTGSARRPATGALSLSEQSSAGAAAAKRNEGLVRRHRSIVSTEITAGGMTASEQNDSSLPSQPRTDSTPRWLTTITPYALLFMSYFRFTIPSAGCRITDKMHVNSRIQVVCV